MSRQSALNPISLQYQVRTCNGTKQNTKALVSVHKNANLVSQFSELYNPEKSPHSFKP